MMLVEREKGLRGSLVITDKEQQDSTSSHSIYTVNSRGGHCRHRAYVISEEDTTTTPPMAASNLWLGCHHGEWAAPAAAVEG
jgi:hypothetical protein